MQGLNLFEIFTSRFHKARIQFVISGSVASIVYGDPRVTHDIDLVVDISKSQIDQLIFNFPLEQFYLPPKDVLNLEVNRENRGHFNIIHNETGFKADVYLCGSDKFLKWAIDNAQIIKFNDNDFPIAPIEYVIIKKLEFYKEGKAQKHLNDIVAMLRESKELIDDNSLKLKIQVHAVESEWKIVEKLVDT
ncbi:MAG: hypothetical protein PVH88_08400 [Ignavibacteria bacterium]|jgi:hypothetical protein